MGRNTYAKGNVVNFFVNFLTLLHKGAKNGAFRHILKELCFTGKAQTVQILYIRKKFGDNMKFSHVFAMAGFVAASFGFVACSDDSSSSPSENTNDSSSSVESSTDSEDVALDCSVSDGVKVVKPAAGDVFKMGDTITVVYGSDVQGSGYRFLFKTSEDDAGQDMLEESAGPEEPDGKTCYVQKVVLSGDDDVAAPSDAAIIRVIPYEKTSKGANSAAFKVTE